jgi:hypothetical protein
MNVNTKKHKLDFTYEIRKVKKKSMSNKLGIIWYIVCINNLNTENIKNTGNQNFTIIFSIVLTKPG